MAHVDSLEDYDEWRSYVAREYVSQATVASFLQFLAANIDRSTWEIRAPRTELASEIGVSSSTFYRRWQEALDTRLIDEVGLARYKAGNRTLTTPVVKLILPSK